MYQIHTYTHIYLCYIVIYTFMQHHNDTAIKTQEGRRTKKGRTQKDAGRKTQEETTQDKDAGRLLFKYIYLSLYCKGSKGLLKGCM